MALKYISTIAICFLFFSDFLNAQSENTGVRIKFNGFGDIDAGVPFGNPASSNEAALFNKYGDPQYPYELRRGLVIHGLDLLTTVYLTDNIKVQAEVNLEGTIASGNGDFDIEVDRLFIDYSISDHFGVQAGLMYTPIGYINRNLYSRAWLQNSLNFYQAVEQSSGLIQSHFEGGTVYGNFAFSDKKGLSYILGVGMPRPNSPTEPIINYSQLGYQFTALLESHTLWAESDLRIGLSGYSDQIHTFYVANYGDIVNMTDPAAPKLLLQETGFNPYVVYKSKYFDVLAEYDYVATNVLQGEYPKQTTLNFLSAEIAFNRKIKGKRFAPYIRYDYILLPADTGPYYGLRDLGNSQLTKDFSPDQRMLMVGVAYDIASFNRLKLEYEHNFDGPFQTDGFFVQTAFGF